MFPNIYNLLNQPEITAIVGDHIGPFGTITQGTPAPYISFHLVGHTPYAQLSGPPLSDSYLFQIDCWHTTQDGCYALAKAVRGRLDNQNNPNQVILMTKESDTELYRISLQTTLIYQR